MRFVNRRRGGEGDFVFQWPAMLKSDIADQRDRQQRRMSTIVPVRKKLVRCVAVDSTLHDLVQTSRGRRSVLVYVIA